MADITKIAFANDKQYNIMYEATLCLCIESLLRDFVPAISVAIPSEELNEVRRIIKGWKTKLSERIVVVDPDGPDELEQQ